MATDIGRTNSDAPPRHHLPTHNTVSGIHASAHMFR
jgi:hypothetical protein